MASASEKREMTGRNRSMSLPSANKVGSRRTLRRRVSFPQEICFHEAVKCGDLREVHVLLVDGGFEMNSLSQSGISALHQCALDGRHALVAALVTAGADIHKRDVDGWQPIHAAAAMGNSEIVEYLLKHGAKADSLTPQNETPADLTEESDEATRSVLMQQLARSRARSSYSSADSGLATGDDSGDEDSPARIAPSVILSKIEQDDCEESKDRVITWPLRHNSVHTDDRPRHAVAAPSPAQKGPPRIKSGSGSDEGLPSFQEAKALTSAKRFSAVETNSPSAPARRSGIVVAVQAHRGTAALIKEAREERKKPKAGQEQSAVHHRGVSKKLSDFEEEIFV